MDPFYTALSFYRRLKYEECAAVCTELLEKNPYDQVCFHIIGLYCEHVFVICRCMARFVIGNLDSEDESCHTASICG
jgi:hypothetical protein